MTTDQAKKLFAVAYDCITCCCLWNDLSL